MPFDAEAYLRTHDLSQRYSICKLTGGVVNVTFRAIKLPNEQASTSSLLGRGGRYPGHDSIILKHAPPYLAAIGPSAPFDTRRQHVEATVLQVFDQARRTKGTSPMRDLVELGCVRVPRFLYHDDDDDAKVLIMSDMGPLWNMSQVFGDLGGSIVVEELSAIGTVTPPRPSIQHLTIVGEHLGRFFSGMSLYVTATSTTEPHSASVREDVETILREKDLSLTNPQAQEFVHKAAIQPLQDHLKRFPDLVSPGEDLDLYKAIDGDFWRKPTATEMSFVLGDCWTGAILVDIPATDPESFTEQAAMWPWSQTSPQIAVIDWEFAHFGRGIHGDIAQLIAHLELLSIAADYRDEPPASNSHVEGLQQFLGAFIQSYRHNHSSALKLAASSQERATIVRSAFLTTGAEILNCTYWKTWPCRHPRCVHRREAPTTRQEPLLECLLLREMATHGIRYLRIAGQTVQEFGERIAGLLKELDGARENDPTVADKRGMRASRNSRKLWLLELFVDILPDVCLSDTSGMVSAHVGGLVP